MFAKRIKELRVTSSLTQKELADKLNSSSSKVAMWETGERQPVPNDLRILSQLFSVSIDYLLGNTDIKDIPLIHTIAAHHDGEDWSEEELQELENFKKYIRSKRSKN